MGLRHFMSVPVVPICAGNVEQSRQRFCRVFVAICVHQAPLSESRIRLKYSSKFTNLPLLTFEWNLGEAQPPGYWNSWDSQRGLAASNAGRPILCCIDSKVRPLVSG